MTTNKPEVVAYATHHDEPLLFPSKREAAMYCDDGEEPLALIHISDYEALQAECEKLRAAMIEAKSYIDHYMYGGSIYREPAAEAIAIIDAAMEGDKP